MAANDKVCGCGTCSELIDAAFKCVDAEIAADSCQVWERMKSALVEQIYANLLAKSFREQGCPKSIAQAMVEAHRDAEHTRLVEMMNGNHDKMMSMTQDRYDMIIAAQERREGRMQ